MQGVYRSTFKGKKQHVEKLLEFIRSQDSDMYKMIYAEDVELPENYDSLDCNDFVEINIGMDSSYNINWFDPYTYFEEVTEAAPELEMEGYYSLNDAEGEFVYRSEAGSSDYDEEYIILCCNCYGHAYEEDSEGSGEYFCSKKCYLEYCEANDVEPDEEYIKLLENEE
jgi:hypothetical protein